MVTITKFVPSDPSYSCVINFGYSRQGFSVALKPVLALALVDHTSLELTEIQLPLPLES